MTIPVPIPLISEVLEILRYAVEYKNAFVKECEEDSEMSGLASIFGCLPDLRLQAKHFSEVRQQLLNLLKDQQNH